MDLEKPIRERDLERILLTASNLAFHEEYEEALAICDNLIESKATEVAGYRKRADIKEQMADLAGATSDRLHVVARFAHEPADFHALGILLLQAGSTLDAIEAFGRAIHIGTASENNYYTSSALIFRAEAHLRRADFEEALADAAWLPDAYRTYIPGSGMRSKEDISAEASAALFSKINSSFGSPPA